MLVRPEKHLYITGCDCAYRQPIRKGFTEVRMCPLEVAPDQNVNAIEI